MCASLCRQRKVMSSQSSVQCGGYVCPMVPCWELVRLGMLMGGCLVVRS